ncbi:MAG: hypothetical protein IJM14_09955 [Lachnospiraceae bacterium]|nr:hypothetical protein [Lachnospiraceae bacterium]
MNKKKEKYIILLKTFFMWLVVFGLSCVTTTVQLIGKEDKGYGGSDFFRVTVYEVNVILIIVGGALFIILFSVLWHFFIFKNLEELKEEHAGYKLFFFILCVIGFFGIFMGIVMTLVATTGIFSALYPSWTESFIFLIPVLALLIVVVDVMINKEKIKK